MWLVALTLAFSPPLWGRVGDRPAPLTAASERFDALAKRLDTCVAIVYARQAESAIQAEASQLTRARSAHAGRPWNLVGRIAAPSPEDLQRAIHVQRALLLRVAREQHSALRFTASVSFAYARQDCVPGDSDELCLGSFRCTRCGAANEADAEECTSCGEPRSPDTPRGPLTLAVAPARMRPLPIGECGFAPSHAEGSNDDGMAAK
jgi:hypothetical protein